MTEATTTTTTIPRVTTGASVLVANANTVGGSAGNMTKTLELAGYTMIDPVNASGPNITDSIVYYDEAQAAAQDVANSVARDLGGVEVLVLPTPAPTESGEHRRGRRAGAARRRPGRKDARGVVGNGGRQWRRIAAAAPDPSDGDVPATAPADADLGTDETDTTEG